MGKGCSLAWMRRLAVGPWLDVQISACHLAGPLVVEGPWAPPTGLAWPRARTAPVTRGWSQAMETSNRAPSAYPRCH